MTKRYASLVFLIILEGVFSTAYAQSDFCAPGKFAYTRYYRGDTIVIACDTSYLFNKATFGLYKGLYQNVGTADQKTKALLTSYDYMKNIYENRIAEQDKEYKLLRSRFDSLAFGSQNFIRTASSNLTEVRNSITLASTSISEAQNNLKTTEKQIKDEIRGSRKKMIQWGLGGFSVGVVATALLSLVFQ